MTFDLSNFRQADTADYKVLNPHTGDETGWVITFAGPGHEKAIKQKNRMLNRGLKRQRVKGDNELTPEEIEAEGVDYIVDRIIEWRGLAWQGEEEKPFTEAFARERLNDPNFSWLRIALNKWLNDEASFIPRSAKA